MEPVKLVKLALTVLTERIILMMTLVMAFVLAIWVMQGKDLTQLFALLVFVVFGGFIVKRDENERQKMPETV